MNNQQTFAEAQRRAAAPGSAVLARWMQTRAASGQLKDVAARAPSGPQALQWAGVSWDEFINGGAASAGVGVNEATARSISAVVACVNLISGSVASLPLHFYRRAGDDRESYKDATWWMLNERPAAAWSAAAFWEYLVTSRLFHGDAFAIIRRARYSGAVEGFEPCHPSRVRVERDTDGRLVYSILPEEAGGKIERIEQDDMIHVPGPGFDGVRSMSQLKYALRNPAGIALTADEQAGTFLKDGARPDFAFEIPGNVTAEQADQIRKTFLERHSGQGSKRAPVVLSGGMKLHQLTLSAEDAQLLATRKFQIEEVCRVMGVPPFMIGHTEKTTSWGSGIGEMGIGFVKYTLQRHLVAIEQEFNNKLFKTSRNFCEFVTAGLERGDIKGRYEAYRVALGRAGEPGWMKPSEIRKLENLPADTTFDEAMNNEPLPAPAGE
jgi:HK97 family phage portal protein